MPDFGGRCPACMRPVRPDTRFCPACGHSFDASAPDAAVSAPRRDTQARFEHKWTELKRVGWLFGLLLATLFVASLAARANPSPWPTAIGSAVLAVITLVAVALRYKRLVFLFKLHPIGAGTSIGLVVISFAFVAVISLYFWALHRLGVPIVSASKEFSASGWPLW